MREEIIENEKEMRESGNEERGNIMKRGRESEKTGKGEKGKMKKKR